MSTNDASMTLDFDKSVHKLLKTVAQIIMCVKEMYKKNDLRENIPLYFAHRGRHMAIQYTKHAASSIFLNSKRIRSIHHGTCIFKITPTDDIPDDLRTAVDKQQISLKHVDRRFVNEELHIKLRNMHHSLSCTIKTHRKDLQLNVSEEVSLTVTDLNKLCESK
jgi:hypothetical protein